MNITPVLVAVTPKLKIEQIGKHFTLALNFLTIFKVKN